MLEDALKHPRPGSTTLQERQRDRPACSRGRRAGEGQVARWPPANGAGGRGRQRASGSFEGGRGGRALIKLGSM